MKDTTKRDKATPTPLPAGGQASALLADRKREAQAHLESLKKQVFDGVFSSGKQRNLTPEQFEQQKQEKMRALLADKKI